MTSDTLARGRARMRRLFRIVPVIVSVLLVAALSGAWVRSYSKIDEISRARGGIVYSVISARGEVHLSRSDRTVAAWPLGIDTYTVRPGWTRAFLYSSGTVRFSFIGIHWVHSSGTGARAPPFPLPATANAALISGPALWLITLSYDSIILPYWLLVLLAALLSARFVFVAVRRARRRRRGWCLTCGYDVREARERCPECGELVTRGDMRTGMGVSPMRNRASDNA